MKKVMYFFVVVCEDNHAVTQVVDPELGYTYAQEDVS